MLPVEQSCFWLADVAGAPAAPPLDRPAEADVAVVGGGFTGLWTAHFLKELEPTLDVVLLEAERIAYGATGRNAGMVGETFDHSHALAISHFGVAEARRLAALARRNLDEMEAFCAGHAPEAAFERSGQLVFALEPRHLEELAEAKRAAEEVGVGDWRLLGADEARAEVASPLYLGALLHPRAATVHPARLALALRREAQRAGVRVHESTPVSAWRARGEGIELDTPAGTVRARRAVLATNAWSAALAPRLGRRFLALYDYVTASEPLADEDLEALGWLTRRRAVTDARAFFHYYRLTPDRRMVWGTSDAVYHPGGRVGRDCDHSPAHYAALAASFRRHFPQLRPLEFPFAWGGPICSTTRFTPFFGALGGGRLLYGLGYTGHGVGTTRVAGRILAHLALEKSSDLLELALVRKPPLPFPPGPLRGWAVGRVTRALRRLDRGEPPGLLLRLLDRLGIGLSS